MKVCQRQMMLFSLVLQSNRMCTCASAHICFLALNASSTSAECQFAHKRKVTILSQDGCMQNNG